jgi:sugar transferase (PEP-CTERM/EpsH1 system associated)
MPDQPIHVVHVIHQLATGGMENGLVNLINGMDPHAVRHSVLCMTDFTDFRDRITRADVAVIALNKKPHGQDFAAQRRAFAQLRALCPDIAHTRNLTGLDAVVPAFLARVPARLHGEHGRDMTDPDGTNKKFILLKKLHRPFIHRWTTVSEDLARALRERVGVPAEAITQIYNGVNLDRFTPVSPRRTIEGFSAAEHFVFGTVGRLQDVKEQWLLIEALALLPALTPRAKDVRVVIVGDGPMRVRLEQLLARLPDIAGQVLLAGPQDDVPTWLQSFDVFCLPSRAEGISNTILEAMACALPVIATRVGGNPELVVDGGTGVLVPNSDAAALAQVMARYVDDTALGRRHGKAGRSRALAEFSLSVMVERYAALYRTMARRA